MLTNRLNKMVPKEFCLVETSMKPVYFYGAKMPSWEVVWLLQSNLFWLLQSNLLNFSKVCGVTKDLKEEHIILFVMIIQTD